MRELSTSSSLLRSRKEVFREREMGPWFGANARARRLGLNPEILGTFCRIRERRRFGWSMEGKTVADWFLNLPVFWMAVIVFAGIFVIAGGVYVLVTRLVDTEWARAFKAVSPGVLPVLGVLFALLVGFIAVEVWTTFDK